MPLGDPVFGGLSFQHASGDSYTRTSRRLIKMSDAFRKSVLNRLPRMPPTRAPWADEPKPGEEDEEELEEEGDSLGSLNRYVFLGLV